jgi:hypothetical protein
VSHLRSTMIALLVVLGFAAGAPDLPGQNPEGRQSLPQGGERLPEGKARVLILEGCVQCHDLKNTVSQRKSLAGWRRTVSEMIWRGAPLAADEARTITEYLAASFGVENRLADGPRTKQREESGRRSFRVNKTSPLAKVN